jgi:DNA modification methylase
MAGDAADLIFTDAPYNVDYEGYTEERLKIQGDRMTDEQFNRFLEAAFRSCRGAVKPGASLYVCHSSSKQREFQNALEAAGFDIRCQIIWAKNTFAWGFGRYKFQHEPMLLSCGGRKGPMVRRQVTIDAVGREEALSQPSAPNDETDRANRTRIAE